MQRLEINGFKGLSTKRHATLIPDLKTPDAQGMFVSPQGALTPIPLINSETTGLGFSQVLSTIPVLFSNNSKYLIVSDGLDLAKTTGDGTYSYIGYTTGTVTRSGTALTGTSTLWNSNIMAGDRFKYDADSTWLTVSTVNSDTSITLTSGSGATSGSYMIRKVLSGAQRPKGVVMNDLLILVNGDRLADKWDGTSLQKISGMPTLESVVKHKRHVFGFTSSTIYWSDLNTPTTWTGTNLETVSQKDGGNIIAFESFANSLVMLKSQGKAYQLVGSAPFDATAPTYQIEEIDMPEAIGTIAPETLTVHKGLLYFLASTGVYVFDGVHVEKTTLDIDPTIETISFPTGTGAQSARSFVDDTSAEFGAGTNSDTEYDTTNNVLQLDQTKLFDDFSDGNFTSNPTWTIDGGGSTWAVTSNKLVNTIASVTTQAAIYVTSTNAYGTWQWDISVTASTTTWSTFMDINFIASSSNHAATNGYLIRLITHGGKVVGVNLYKITAGVIVAGLIYGSNPNSASIALKVTRTNAGLFELFVDGASQGTSTDTTYTTSAFMLNFPTRDISSTGTSTVSFDNIYTSAITGNFISQVFDGTASQVSWNSITFNTTLNGEAATYSYRAEGTNPPVGAFTTITSGQTLTTGATNRYLQYKIAYTSSTKVGITPTTSSVTVNQTLSLDSASKPVAKSFKDRWHMSYSTSGSTNTDTLIFDEAGEWLPWKGTGGCYGIFSNKLYVGGVDGTVKVWYAGGTTAVGQSRYYKTKIFDLSSPEYVKDFDRIAIVFKFTTCTCSIDYSVNEGTFSTSTVSLISTGSTDVPVRTIQVGQSGTRIQIRVAVSDETQDFEIHRIILYYQGLELRS